MVAQDQMRSSCSAPCKNGRHQSEREVGLAWQRAALTPRSVEFCRHRATAIGGSKGLQRVGYGPSLRGDERRLDDRHRPFMPEWQLSSH